MRVATLATHFGRLACIVAHAPRAHKYSSEVRHDWWANLSLQMQRLQQEDHAQLLFIDANARIAEHQPVSGSIHAL
eukprot:3338341-Alexandrium_andersonii.AAC.1